MAERGSHKAEVSCSIHDIRRFFFGRTRTRRGIIIRMRRRIIMRIIMRIIIRMRRRRMRRQIE